MVYSKPTGEEPNTLFNFDISNILLNFTTWKHS